MLSNSLCDYVSLSLVSICVAHYFLCTLTPFADCVSLSLLLSLFLSMCYLDGKQRGRERVAIICKALRDSAEQSNGSHSPPPLHLPPCAQLQRQRRRRLAYSCKFDLDTILFHNRKANKWGGGDVKQLGEGNTYDVFACVCVWDDDNDVCDREAKSVKHSCNNSTHLSSAEGAAQALASQLTPTATCQNLTLCTQHISHCISQINRLHNYANNANNVGEFQQQILNCTHMYVCLYIYYIDYYAGMLCLWVPVDQS